MRAKPFYTDANLYKKVEDTLIFVVVLVKEEDELRLHGRASTPNG